MRFLHSTAGRGGAISSNGAYRAALTIGLAMSISLVASSARAQAITACVNSKNGAVTIRSSLEKGACPKGTEPIVLNPMAAPSPTALKLQTLTVQTINVVDAGNNTVATLEKNSNGNLLTFFDSNGHKTVELGNTANETSAGMSIWDGNNVVPGNGVPRETVGESNPGAGSVNGFGVGVYDGAGKVRSGLYLTYDGTTAGAYAIDSNGSTAGFDTNQTAQNEGFYVNDLNGKTRSFLGNSLDGTTNAVELFDSTGAFAGDIYQGLNGAKTSTGTFLTLENPSGHIALGETDDANGVAWVLFDPNEIVRMFGEIDGANDFIQEFDPSSNLIGHLP